MTTLDHAVTPAQSDNELPNLAGDTENPIAEQYGQANADPTGILESDLCLDALPDPSDGAEQWAHGMSMEAASALADPLDPHKASSSPMPPEFVVAIGASAGGLDALERLFTRLPCNNGAAYVVIQHLSPDHKSIMDSLLARYTDMPVSTVTNDMCIEANRVYLIPPGAMMHIDGNRFRLTPKFRRVLNLPIDVFFQSLAQQFKSRSVGVVLSGTGSDGTRGAAAINEAGGLLLAQEPESAKFDGMPRSIIATGLVDAILPLEEMAERITQHVLSANPELRGFTQSLKANSTEEQMEMTLRDILRLLRQAVGINFEDYKSGTVTRRLERRMAVRQVNTLESYLELLHKDRTELLTLRRELLIPVTSFFRDTEAFSTLKREVVQQLLANKADGEGIRVWCAGIATGEEAYSIAMLFLEAFEEAKVWPALKIFATDVEQLNIDTASAGVYPESIMAEITDEQLNRFFTKRGSQYVVKSEVRQCIVFARHNLLSDPPFTKMDLIICRNVLIYFRNAAQQRVLRRMQYALAPNGHLFLGSSESLGSLQPDFHTVSARYKIWRLLRANKTPLGLESNLSPTYTKETLTLPSKSSSSLLWRSHAQTSTQRGYQTLLQAFAPPSALLLNANLELVHTFGEASQYLVMRGGQASLEISHVLPDPLVPVATALVFKAMREQISTSSEIVHLPVPTAEDGKARKSLRLSAWPVPKPEEGSADVLTLLVFEEVHCVTPSAETQVNVHLENTERMDMLQHELAATRESLQATIEELETSNEELQATNEEMMASNEELQSSNEELQSVNEELNTVNAEYQEKIDILNRVNADLDSLAKVVASGTVFVDEKLQLTRFSPDATHIFRLRNSDIGRPLMDLSHVLHYPQLIQDLERTLQEGILNEKDVSAPGGRNYLVRMLPYSVPSSAERGVVLSFIDMTSARRALHLQAILDAEFGHVAVLDNSGVVLLTNQSWQDAVKQASPEAAPLRATLGDNYLELCLLNKAIDNGEWGKYAATQLRSILLGHQPQMTLHYKLANVPYVMHAKALANSDGGVVVQHMNLSQIMADADKPHSLP